MPIKKKTPGSEGFKAVFQLADGADGVVRAGLSSCLIRRFNASGASSRDGIPILILCCCQRKHRENDVNRV